MGWSNSWLNVCPVHVPQHLPVPDLLHSHMQWHSAVVATNFTDCLSLFVDGSDGNKVQDLFAAST